MTGFRVIAGLVPIMWTAVALMTGGQTVNCIRLLCREGLLLLTATIAVGAIAELIASGERYSISQYIAGGACIMGLVGCCLWYSTVADFLATGTT